jgi:tetraacyldisaccharide 4'-kinase
MKNLILPDNRGKKGIVRALVFGILFIFSWLYGLIYLIRLSLFRLGIFKQRKLKAKVISVGNITLGGTGKTPLVIYLAKKLSERDENPTILTRGYGRKKKEMVELTEDTYQGFNWEDAGDEPLVMAGRLPGVPILVSKNRRTSGHHAVQKFGNHVLILDDGFQHLKLFRDLDIVVIDATNPFGNGKFLPAGILREPLSSLRRADVFVLTKTDQTSNKDELKKTLREFNPEAIVAESVYRIRSIIDFASGTSVESKGIENKKALAFSAIGNPSSFENSLKTLKVRLIKHRTFRDHHPYKSKEISDLGREAKELKADFLITTEKDSVRIPLIKETEIPIYVLKIDLTVTQGEQILFNKIEGTE